MIIVFSLGLHSLLLCNISFTILVNLGFLSFSLVLHFTACITVERYCTISSAKYRINKKNVNKIVACICTYVTLSWLPVIITYMNITGSFIDKNLSVSFCKFYFTCSTRTEGSNLPQVLVVTAWLCCCNVAILRSTRFTIVFIKVASRQIREVLGDQGGKTETKRITVAVALCVCFNAVWVPYGVIAGQRNKISFETYASLAGYWSIVAYASFLVLPVVYFFMDSRFEKYVTTFFKLNSLGLL